ncbi:ComF family protein [uncultured Sphingomonas sp.]|uniref:ComF family protein n=1 Tax=uncultured Sphingomonas sp. TaxID=158754 RepID=UPI000AA7ED38|nr:ComF family protein [Sphingomonas sp. SCN 67-18]
MPLPAPLRVAIDYALPPRCPGCGAIVDGDHRFCLACWSRLDFLGGPGCAACNHPFAFERPGESLCAACIADPPDHDGVHAVVSYGPVARAVILKLKYGRKPAIARIVAQHLVRHAAPFADALLVPVPLHRWRIWSRGFNQSALIARALAARTGLPVAMDAIRRTRATPPLQAMGKAARARTVRGAFTVHPSRRAALSGQTILLVDDVYTSGATANACARALKRAGAARVVILCWARVIQAD